MNGNDEAERALLGIIILDQRWIDRIIPTFEVADFKIEGIAEPFFASPANQLIFDTILRLHHGGEVVGLQTVAADLLDRGQLDIVGGALYLASLEDFIFSTQQALTLARIIARHRAARLYLRVAGEVSRFALAGDLDAAGQLAARGMAFKTAMTGGGGL